MRHTSGKKRRLARKAVDRFCRSWRDCRLILHSGWTVFTNKERAPPEKQRPFAVQPLIADGAADLCHELVNFAQCRRFGEGGGDRVDFSPEETTLRVRLICPALRTLYDEPGTLLKDVPICTGLQDRVKRSRGLARLGVRIAWIVQLNGTQSRPSPCPSRLRNDLHTRDCRLLACRYHGTRGNG